ncbi:hypothetical protein BH23ACT5_BH23ACT5_09530 [soil metagenome]
MVEPITEASPADIERWHRTFAPRFFNRTWELMDRIDLDADEIDEMLASAFAQRAHWYAVGDARKRAIADWQVSRAAILGGHPLLARRFAERSLAGSTGLDPFVAAIARAAAAVDDVGTFEAHILAARELSLQVTDPQERRTIDADLDQMCL